VICTAIKPLAAITPPIEISSRLCVVNEIIIIIIRPHCSTV